MATTIRLQSEGMRLESLSLRRIKAAQPHGTRYPWTRWLQPLTKRVYKRGIHFTIQPHGFAKSVKQAAKRMRIKTHVTILEDVVTVEVLQ